MELFMSLDGVGLSLVNSKPDEVAYITLSRYDIQCSCTLLELMMYVTVVPL